MASEINKVDLGSAALMVVDEAHAMLAYWDKDLVCRFANAAYLEFFGRTREEMVDKMSIDQLLGPLFELNLPYIKGVLAGAAQLFERAIPIPTGDVRYTLANYLPHIIDGQVLGFFVHVADITPTKMLEKELLRIRLLETKNKDLEHFAHIASHDLQEPLATVRSYIGILEHEYATKMDQKAMLYLKGIDKSVTRMSTLVKALADLSRLGLLGEKTQVNCNALLKEVEEDLASQIRLAGAAFSVSPLPTVTGYAVELRQLFQNIISNALKFRKQDVAPLISINCTLIDGFWQFAIADNGIGIAAKYYDKIFDIFKRLHLKQQYDGEGIGLANCKKIAELHGGKIWVTSVEGQGSTFYFTIPQTQNDHA